MSKIKLITQAELSRMLGVSKPAITKAVKNGNIKVKIIDGKKYINPNLKHNQLYITNASNKRIDGKQQMRPMKKKTGKASSEKKGKSSDKTKKVKPKSKKKVKNNDSESIGGEIVPYNDRDGLSLQLSYYKARAEKEQQMAIHKKLQNAKMRGELLDREAVYKIFLYIDKVHSNLERLGDSFLSDTGAQIITAGKVTPTIRGRWRTGVLQQIDDAKKAVMKMLKEIDKEQAG